MFPLFEVKHMKAPRATYLERSTFAPCPEACSSFEGSLDFCHVTVGLSRVDHGFTVV